MENYLTYEQEKEFYNMMQAYRHARHDPVYEYQEILDWIGNIIECSKQTDALLADR